MEFRARDAAGRRGRRNVAGRGARVVAVAVAVARGESGTSMRRTDMSYLVETSAWMASSYIRDAS